MYAIRSYYGVGDRPCQLNVVTVLRPVRIHRREQYLTCPIRRHLFDIFDGIDPRRFPAAVRVHLEPSVRPLRVDGDNDALRASYNFV